MKIVWSRRAIGHLVALRDYIAEDSPENAAAVASRLLESVDLLVVHPQIGRAGPDPSERVNWWYRIRLM